VTRDATWTEQVIILDPGDTLVSFSDGLFDLLGGTTAALTDVATMVTGSTSCAHLMQRVTTLAAQEMALIDDVTVVAIHRAAITTASG
jgi:serine phosphatase RsbU (regulator of sigma subunit)